MAVICNRFVYTGSEEANKFASLPSVQNLYRSTLLGTVQQAQAEYTNDDNEPLGGDRLGNMLKTHVFDMDTDMLRSVLSHAAAPPRAIGAKDSRRGWYGKAENCPDWWAATGIEFQSVNQSAGSGKKLGKLALMSLVKSLQNSLRITPIPPLKVNRTSYVSLFSYDEEAMDTDDTVPVCTTPPADMEPPLGSTQQYAGATPLSGTQPCQPCASNEPSHSQPCASPEPSGTQPCTSAVPSNTQQCVGLDQKKALVKEILDMEISWEEKSIFIMKIIDNWDALWGLADFVLSAMPPLPAQLASSWKAPELVKLEKYKAFGIPLDVGERSIRKTTSNGNCIFNAISIALYGDEAMALPLKLGSVLAAAENIVPFTKYLCEEYVNQQRM